MEVPMDEALLREIRSELEHDRDDLTATLSGLATSKDDPLAEMLSAGLVELHRTLEKLDRGGFGACETCTGPIGEDRLRKLPTSRECAKCEAEATETSSP
jgi:DnaK suppressor protein